MSCLFTGPKKFWAGPNFLCLTKNLFTYTVTVTNILYQTKRWFASSKIGFCAGTKVFEEALNAVKFLGWLKKFGPARNILGLVKGQGIKGQSISECPFDVLIKFSKYQRKHLTLFWPRNLKRDEINKIKVILNNTVNYIWLYGLFNVLKT